MVFEDSSIDIRQRTGSVLGGNVVGAIAVGSDQGLRFGNNVPIEMFAGERCVAYRIRKYSSIN